MTAVLKRPARSTASLMLLLGVPTALPLPDRRLRPHALLSGIRRPPERNPAHAGEQRLAHSFCTATRANSATWWATTRSGTKCTTSSSTPRNTAGPTTISAPYVATAFGARAHPRRLHRRQDRLWLSRRRRRRVPESDADRQRLEGHRPAPSPPVSPAPPPPSRAWSNIAACPTSSPPPRSPFRRRSASQPANSRTSPSS